MFVDSIYYYTSVITLQLLTDGITSNYIVRKSFVDLQGFLHLHSLFKHILDSLFLNTRPLIFIKPLTQRLTFLHICFALRSLQWTMVTLVPRFCLFLHFDLWLQTAFCFWFEGNFMMDRQIWLAFGARQSFGRLYWIITRPLLGLFPTGLVLFYFQFFVRLPLVEGQQRHTTLFVLGKSPFRSGFLHPVAVTGLIICSLLFDVFLLEVEVGKFYVFDYFIDGAMALGPRGKRRAFAVPHFSFY